MSGSGNSGKRGKKKRGRIRRQTLTYICKEKESEFIVKGTSEHGRNFK